MIAKQSIRKTLNRNQMLDRKCFSKILVKEQMAPGKGFEPLRARSPPANLPSGFSPLLLDLEAGALTTLPPRLVHKRMR